ncbi:MAG: valine--tRNA ligase [Flavobacteriaceae bacterium]|nr:valine--tRNA ligase [Flavobacteriaceae bacterium]|tara:strand:- start:9982 stop:12615 length:2634 start_codon:yes stop_codon:yes gene_type:complete
MSIPSKFISIKVEKKWYSYWIKNNFFDSIPDSRDPYTIVIPPPNVTGVLHMGHMLNNTLQDILIRRARMMGYNACWVPGTDHASIATEAKVVEKLKKDGIKKSDLSREDFLEYAWKWTSEYGGIILDQLKMLGCSCDWKRTKFTLDDKMSDSVIKVFIDLYNKGLIYRGYRMLNWDPKAQTTLSEEEVLYEEREAKIYHIAYKLYDSEEKIVIATTRPETLLGDTAVCINPKDRRYSHLAGKSVLIPIVNRKVPIIEDDYVDIDFGTGCLKVTPAHDFNDNVLGEKHNLEVIDIFNPDGSLNQNGLHYVGQDRFLVREKIINELKEKGLFIKEEKYIHNVAISERTKVVIEPRLSKQWFLKMEELAKPAINSVLNKDEIKLVPEKFINTYKHWMENIKDWNISRQLWWGHQIPVYYYGDNDQDYVVASSKEIALKEAKEKTKNPKLNLNDLKQDDDVLDTWFSSWIWPISVFDGILNPENPQINYYYPTQDLVTGPDIIFFWVSRMIISGYEFRKEKPFSNVYFTGIVRDKLGRKMSKQLGNSPDAIELIKTYGADAVRVGLMLSSNAGNDLLFDESLCKQGKNFANKIWNAYRLFEGWKIDKSLRPNETNLIAIEWFKNLSFKVINVVEDHFTKYRISDALMTIYKFIWEEFCSWFLEIVKPDQNNLIDEKTLNEIKGIFEINLKLLAPFMPFITEELWHLISKREVDQALIISSWPAASSYDNKIINDFELVKKIVIAIRNFRKEKAIGFKERLTLIPSSKINLKHIDVIKKMGGIESIKEHANTKNENYSSFRVENIEFFIPSLSVKIDQENEKRKIKIELDYSIGFLNSVEKKLSDKKFISNAPKKVVELEEKKKNDVKLKISLLKKALSKLD